MPDLKIKSGGALVSPVAVKTKVGGALANVIAVWTKQGGTLVKLWPLTEVLTITPTSSTRNVASNQQISQTFTVGGSSGSGTWTAPAGVTLSGTGTSCTASATQASGNITGNVTFTESGTGRTVSAPINWTWGNIS